MAKRQPRIVNTRFAKSESYLRVLEEIKGKGKCPFCPKNFHYHKKPILKTIGNWFITENSWPYHGTKHHFLIIGTQHIEHITGLKGADIKEIFSLATWATETFHIKGGALTMRFGDTDYTGSSVAHLHAHLIVPKIKPRQTTAVTVNFPIG